ncbi:MBL fold metallo-hydrolase [Pelobacter propionicus]|uniref:Beta-lactamase domain protein n=1 Tax=Pelobacter propionicus (strain DSM 2379 / NBRC 103807 / OttBd1) TaxID=338966 RepID=A1AKC7_PELPD|nr:MBL fold metallo-hydrolase [Pelobacter propionicus]ABK97797.1 beta-lactamase domain protein [Pelobacter propionicus DSM 2379]
MSSERALISALQAYNTFTVTSAPFSDYVHLIHPGDFGSWLGMLNADQIGVPPRAPLMGLTAEVSGATLLIGDADGAILVDPGRYTPMPLQSRPPLAIVITHAHRDHFDGLSDALQSWKDVPVYLSEITRTLLTDSLQRDNANALARELSERAILVAPDATLTVGRFRMTAYDAGHCLGATAVHLEDAETGQGILIAGEFSRRKVGSVCHKIPQLSVNTLFVEAIHADDHLPTGVNGQNNVEFTSKLDAAYAQGKTIVIAAASLAEMQEVYAICALHQRRGGLPEYPLYVGNLRPVMKSALKHLERVEPWDLDVTFTNSIQEEAINILTCAFEGQTDDGHFSSAYAQDSANEDILWLYPERYSALKPEKAALYRVFTHASLCEIGEMVLVQKPANVCLYSGGCHGSVLAGFLARSGFALHDFSGAAGSFHF